MPIGMLAGLAGRLGAGKILGKIGSKILKRPGTAIVRRPPNLPSLPTMPRIPTGVIRGTAGTAAVSRKGIGRKAAELIAAGVAFEAGGKIYNAITGKEIKQSRRMNPGNTKALKRSVRRLNSAAKMYGKVLSATKGTRSCGYTIKPKKTSKRC